MSVASAAVLLRDPYGTLTGPLWFRCKSDTVGEGPKEGMTPSTPLEIANGQGGERFRTPFWDHRT